MHEVEEVRHGPAFDESNGETIWKTARAARVGGYVAARRYYTATPFSFICSLNSNARVDVYVSRVPASAHVHVVCVFSRINIEFAPYSNTYYLSARESTLNSRARVADARLRTYPALHVTVAAERRGGYPALFFAKNLFADQTRGGI